MPKRLFFEIPKEQRNNFLHCYEVMQDKTPLGCWNSSLEYDPHDGIVSVEDINAMSPEHFNYFKQALKSCHAAKAVPSKQTILDECIYILEKITRKKIILRENNEASKNMAVQSLKAVSEALDVLKQNVNTAIQQVNNLSGQDITITKLRGLSSIIDSSITDISEAITNVTGIQTMDDETLQEDANDKSQFIMNTDDALKDLNNVDKIIDKGNTITLTDDNT